MKHTSYRMSVFLPWFGRLSSVVQSRNATVSLMQNIVLSPLTQQHISSPIMGEIIVR